MIESAIVGVKKPESVTSGFNVGVGVADPVAVGFGVPEDVAVGDDFGDDVGEPEGVETKAGPSAA